MSIQAIKDALKANEELQLTEKQAKIAADTVFDTIIEGLVEDGKFQLLGFGTFEVRERAARKGRNPQSGEEIEIPATHAPAFKAGKALKDKVQAKYNK